MKLYLGHKSALDYWCWNDVPSRLKTRKMQNVALTAPTPELIRFARAELNPFKTPLHVIVAHENDKRNLKNICCHSATNSIPPYSFFRHSAHVAVSSPEACFLQLALTTDPISLIYIGCELCGTYSIDPISGKMLSRRPRTKLAFLHTYLNRADGIRGSIKAQKALTHILENSASPMETKIALLMSLPTSMGGYGIPQPELNAQVTHSFSDTRHPERFRCDLYWPTVKLALEYDSHQYHASSEKVVLDSTRRMKIESEKIHVLSVTKQQIYNPYEFEKLVGVIARYLGHRIRINRKDFDQRRQHLRAKLGLPE